MLKSLLLSGFLKLSYVMQNVYKTLFTSGKGRTIDFFEGEGVGQFFGTFFFSPLGCDFCEVKRMTWIEESTCSDFFS